MTGIETIMLWCNRNELQQRIKDTMDLGWEVLYVIPQLAPLQVQQNYGSSGSYSGSVTRNNDDSISIHIPGRGYNQPQTVGVPDPGFEVCFYKKPPCPRCSFPHPDDSRIDRET